MMHEKPNEIEQVLHAQELIELLARITKRLNSGIAPTTLDARTLYCHKTGKPCGTRDLTALNLAIQVHGVDKIERTMLLSLGGNCDPLWQQTDSNTLDVLMKHDPRGYAVYCLKLLTAKFYKPPYVPKNETHYASLEQIWSLARAYQILGNLDQMELASLNDNLCGILTFYNPHVPSGNDVFTWIGKLARKKGINSDVRHPDDFAMLAWRGLLVGILETATTEAINSIGRHNIAVMRNPEKFAEIPKTPSELASRAPSQIRGQRKAKQSVFDAEMLRLYGEAILNDPNAPPPGQEQWRSRISALRVDDSAIDTTDFADMSFDLNVDTRKPDDKVSVRRMSPMLLRTMRNPAPNLAPRAPLTPQEFAKQEFANLPTVSIRDRLAGMKPIQTKPFLSIPARNNVPVPVQSAKSGLSPQSLLNRLRNKDK